MVKHVWATLRAAEIAKDVLGEDELQHWGIKGMRWGIRRYQNRDGTLTNAGKRRYNRELEKIKEQERILKNKQATKAKLDKLNARAAKLKEDQDALDPDVAARNQKAAAKAAKKAEKAEAKSEAKVVEKSIKEMSNEELSRAIERLKLESDYRKYTTPEKVSAGESWFKTNMKSAGTKLLVEGIGAGAAAIIKSKMEKQFNVKSNSNNQNNQKK